MFIILNHEDINFAGTILKFTAKSYAPQCAPQTAPVFVVSAFVLGLELPMDVFYSKSAPRSKI